LQWIDQCHAAEYFYQIERGGGGELILEVKREFDSKGTEKENHCQSEKQFT
jgi:hypothetical protein